jgi:hypothetical protein
MKQAQKWSFVRLCYSMSGVAHGIVSLIYFSAGDWCAQSRRIEVMEEFWVSDMSASKLPLHTAFRPIVTPSHAAILASTHSTLFLSWIGMARTNKSSKIWLG